MYGFDGFRATVGRGGSGRPLVSNKSVINSRTPGGVSAASFAVACLGGVYSHVRPLWGN
jgi:hypothetical protein